MEHHDIAAFSQSWGLVYLLVLFIGVVTYALWPSNRGKFEQAARQPLEEE